MHYRTSEHTRYPGPANGRSPIPDHGRGLYRRPAPAGCLPCALRPVAGGARADPGRRARGAGRGRRHRRVHRRGPGPGRGGPGLPRDQRADAAAAAGPDAAVSLATLAGRERLFVRSVFGSAGPTFPFGAHVAVVEVDTETGRAVLGRLVTVDDAGTVLNPLLAEGQRHGGIAQGAAQAFRPATTRWAPRASAKRARSGRPRRCRTRSSTRWPPSASGTSTCPCPRSGSGRRCGRPRRFFLNHPGRT